MSASPNSQATSPRQKQKRWGQHQDTEPCRDTHISCKTNDTDKHKSSCTPANKANTSVTALLTQHPAVPHPRLSYGFLTSRPACSVYRAQFLTEYFDVPLPIAISPILHGHISPMKWVKGPTGQLNGRETVCRL